MNYNDLINLSKEDLIKIILMMEKRIQYLEQMILKDSHNSSKPPSTDKFKKKR